MVSQDFFSHTLIHFNPHLNLRCASVKDPISQVGGGATGQHYTAQPASQSPQRLKSTPLGKLLSPAGKGDDYTKCNLKLFRDGFHFNKLTLVVPT